MTVKEALALLNAREFYEAPPDLTRMTALLEKLGNPQEGLHFAHIGGTNGKGSVSAMLYAILNRCEYKTGLFTSPHLFSVCERIQVDSKNIPEEVLGELSKPVFEVADTLVAEGMAYPTLQELTLAIAMLYFKSQKVELAVIEVGSGGALDPTNVLGTPEVTVLTNMDFHHQMEPVLPLKDFVMEQAGILKEGTHLVLYDQEEQVMDIVTAHAQELKIPVKISSSQSIKLLGQTSSMQKLSIDGKMAQLPLVGSHQRCNVALTLDAIQFLKEHGFACSSGGVLAGFSHTTWPGRFERVHLSPDFILDGCHNIQSTKAVINTLQEVYPEKEIVFLVGMLEGRDVEGMISEILPYAKKFVTVTPNNPHAISADVLANRIQALTSLPVVAAAMLSSGVQMSLELADKEDVVCAFGSMHIVGEIRQMLGLC